MITLEDGWLLLLDGLQVHRWFLHVQPWLDELEMQIADAAQIDLSHLKQYPQGIRWHLLEALRSGLIQIVHVQNMPFFPLLDTFVVSGCADRCVAGRSPLLDPHWLLQGIADGLSHIDRAELLLHTAGFRPLVELNVAVILFGIEKSVGAQTFPLWQTITLHEVASGYELGEEIAQKAALHMLQCIINQREHEKPNAIPRLIPTERDLIVHAVALGVRLRYATALQRATLLDQDEQRLSLRRIEQSLAEVEKISSSVYTLAENVQSIRLYDFITTYVPHERQFARFSDGSGPGQ